MMQNLFKIGFFESSGSLSEDFIYFSKKEKSEKFYLVNDLSREKIKKFDLLIINLSKDYTNILPVENINIPYIVITDKESLGLKYFEKGAEYFVVVDQQQKYLNVLEIMIEKVKKRTPILTQNITENAEDKVALIINRTMKLMPALIIYTDSSLTIKMVAGKSLQELKYKSSDFLGRNIDCIYSREIVDKIYEKYELRELINFNNKYFDSWSTQIFDDEGKKSGYLLVLRDITEFIVSKKKLTESEDKYKILIKNAPIGIIFADENGNITEVNPVLLQVLASPSEEETKKINVLSFPPLVDIGFAADFRICIKDGTTIEREIYYKTKWGKYVWMRYHLVCMYGQKGEVIGVQALIEDVTERKNTEERIKESLREKELLLKEIHHRVKNNFQIISSLLSLQEVSIKDKISTYVFKDSQNRIKSMALIHEELYKAVDISRIDFEQYIKNLTNYLYQSYISSSDNITFDIQTPSIFLDIETAIPLGLIINELVSNSLKYAFSSSKKNKQNKIFLSIDKDSNELYKLIVSDNGVGIPNKIDFRNTDSLGLQLIISLTEQIDGNIELDSSNGTKFIITFRELNYKKE